MDLANQVLAAGGLFAPGFIAMRLIYTFGAHRQRVQWEWVTWSVLLSLPIKAAADYVKPWAIENGFGESTPDDVRDAVLRLTIALIVAGATIAAWYLIKRSDRGVSVWLRRNLTDSAFDDVLDDAVIHQRWVWVATKTAGEYIGWVHTAGREDSGAEPWMYLEGRCTGSPRHAGIRESVAPRDPTIARGFSRLSRRQYRGRSSLGSTGFIHRRHHHEPSVPQRNRLPARTPTVSRVARLQPSDPPCDAR